MARGAATAEKNVDLELAKTAFAKSVDDGDMVTFNILFSSLSPVRAWTTEVLESDKYQYLLPNDEQESSASFQEALAMVSDAGTWQFITRELEAKRPAQLPSELLIPLADNAVRKRKFSMAAQAYELLRIRRRMRAEFFAQAKSALKEGNITKAVQGILIGTGLSYDYAAFPEPLPKVANYQTGALVVHGRYPRSPEECVAVQPPEIHTNAAISYLLSDDDAFEQLKDAPLDARIQFLKELIYRIDPQWDRFVARYREACDLIASYADRMKHENVTLEDEIEEQQGQNPVEIMETLLGRSIENGAWWQYLKDLAYVHPASVLFVARQRIGDHEVIMPRMLAGSDVPKELGLSKDAPLPNA